MYALRPPARAIGPVIGSRTLTYKIVGLNHESTGGGAALRRSSPLAPGSELGKWKNTIPRFMHAVFKWYSAGLSQTRTHMHDAQGIYLCEANEAARWLKAQLPRMEMLCRPETQGPGARGGSGGSRVRNAGYQPHKRSLSVAVRTAGMVEAVHQPRKKMCLAD